MFMPMRRVFLFLAFVLFLTGCKTGDAFLDLTELFQKNWRTKTVQEEGVLVYDLSLIHI